jgi:ATP-dependent DNA ligase
MATRLAHLPAPYYDDLGADWFPDAARGLDSKFDRAYLFAMDLSRERKSRLVGFIEPCLPSPAKVPPSGPHWIHEIKHDGFRIMARRDAAGVRLRTRKGNDLTRRFPFIAMAVAALPVPSCLIDGEAIVSGHDGLAIFDRIRRHGTLASATLCAFDLLQVDGWDLRREPLEARKRALAKPLCAKPASWRGKAISKISHEEKRKT